MLPRIQSVTPLPAYQLQVLFEDGKTVLYDMREDIASLRGYAELTAVPGLFEQVCLDDSRTCIYWNENIDLPSDTLYEYGLPMQGSEAS